MAGSIGELLDMKRYFYIQQLALGSIGVDITSEVRIWRSPWKTLLFVVDTVFVLGSMAHFTVENIDALEKVTGAMGPFIQCVVNLFKVWIFIYNREDMVRLIRRIWLLIKKSSNDELQIVRQENRRDIMLSFTYSFMVTLTIVMIVGTPMIIYVYYLVTNSSALHEKPIEMLFPFQMSFIVDPLPPLNYFFLYSCGVFFSAFYMGGTLGVDSLLSWYIHNMAAQYRVLRLQIRKTAKEANPIELEMGIRGTIANHQVLIDICDELNRVFGPIILVEIVFNVVAICFLTYQLGSTLTFEIVTFFFSISLQLIIYCYGGQKIQNESELIAYEIYQAFDWHSIPVRTQKLLLLPLLRAQHSCSLNGYFFVVDLSLFLMVMRTAGSYVSVLWSLEEET